jgi:putative membrane protein
MMHDWGWGWGGGMLFGPLFMIAGPVVLIVLLVLLTSWLTSRREGSVGVRSAREILDERFANCEIEREEYEERRKALGA